MSAEVVVWLSHSKRLDEFVIAYDLVSLARSPAWTDVLDRCADKNDCPAIFGDTFDIELINEAFDVKLAKHKFLRRNSHLSTSIRPSISSSHDVSRSNTDRKFSC